MNTVTTALEASLASDSQQFLSLYREATDIVKAYFSTTATTLIGNVDLPNGDAVTVSSKLTKLKFVQGITFCQQIQNLFGNEVVAGPADYMSNLQQMLNGTTPALAPLSNDVEALGDRLKSMAGTVVEIYKRSKNNISLYNSSELAAALTQLSLSTIIFGCSTSKQRMVDGMNLLSNFVAMLEGSAVTQGDYLSIVSKWTEGA